jgi:hypothetical protein
MLNALRRDHSFPEDDKEAYRKIFLSSVNIIDNEDMLSDDNRF